MEGDNKRVTTFLSNEVYERAELKNQVDTYLDTYTPDKGGVETRKDGYTGLVNQFYDLVTNFYEYGWGQSFHFAPRRHWESFEASIFRHEMYLAHRIGLFKGLTALDVGCGVGGPARTIAVFSEGNVVGLNNNDYQLKRARILTEEAGFSDRVSYLKADFMNIPVADDTYDAVYAIEATCHAPDLTACYSEIFRVLKPGCYFGLYEWTMTDKYDPTNEEHVRIKEGIEKGNGVADLVPRTEVEKAVRNAGFELVESMNRADVSDPRTPWYLPLSGSFSITGFKHSRWGRWMTHKMVGTLEWMKLAPTGTAAVSKILMDTAEDLVKGGELGIFTPMWFVLGRKPEKSE